MVKYVPVLQWKKGEQTAYKNLKKDSLEVIKPYLIIPYPDKTKTVNKQKVVKTTEEIIKEGRHKLLTSIKNLSFPNSFFISLNSEWYLNNNDNDDDQDFDLFKQFYHLVMKNNATPVFNLTQIQSWCGSNTPDIFKNGVCIELRDKDFKNIKLKLDSVIKNNIINPANTDLLINLEYVNQSNINAKESIVEDIFKILNNIKFRTIILSSCSFPTPTDLTKEERFEISKYTRYESIIFNDCIDIAKKYNIDIVYSDHGPNDLEETEFIPGMTPNFKIKYSTEWYYLFIKGENTKKGGLDIDKVRLCSNILTSSKDFLGSNFSWGDEIINGIANGDITKSGNLTSWVGYCCNHHITLINNLI